MAHLLADAAFIAGIVFSFAVFAQFVHACDRM